MVRKRTTEPEEEPRAKQPKLQVSGSAASHSPVPQAKVDHLIIDFVINYMEPLSVVEEPSFIDLVTGLQPTRTVMTRKTPDGKPLFVIYLCILFLALNSFVTLCCVLAYILHVVPLIFELNVGLLAFVLSETNA